VFEYAFSNPAGIADVRGLSPIMVNFNARGTNRSIILGVLDESREGIVVDLNGGTTSITDERGNVTATFPSTSGLPPDGRGALPPGDYRTTRPVTDVEDIPRNKPFCDPSGKCWFQRIEPEFPTSRCDPATGYCGFHPDGNVPGTDGCVGFPGDTSGVRGALKDLPVGSPVRVVP